MECCIAFGLQLNWMVTKLTFWFSKRKDKKAARRFFRKLLKGQQAAPIIT
jgi:transposase-like protein